MNVFLCSYDVQKVCSFAHLLPPKHADSLTWPVKRLFLWGVQCAFQAGFAKQLIDLGLRFSDQPPDFGWKTRRSLCAKGEGFRVFFWVEPRREQSKTLYLAGSLKGDGWSWLQLAGSSTWCSCGAGLEEDSVLANLLQGRCWGAARTGLDLCRVTSLGRVLGCPVWEKSAVSRPHINILKLHNFSLYFSICIFNIVYINTKNSCRTLKIWPGVGMATANRAAMSWLIWASNGKFSSFQIAPVLNISVTF